MSGKEFKLSRESEKWIIEQVDVMTRRWSEETWKILGITRDLIDIKRIKEDKK